MGQKILCSECFSNIGLRAEALRVGKKDDTTCENCSSCNGIGFDREALEDLLTRFFVEGSRQPYLPTVYKINHSQTDEELYRVHFDETLQHDYELVAKRLARLRYHAPRLTWMGYGDTYGAFERALNDFDDAGDRKAITRVTSEILNRCTRISLEKGQKLYRIRTNPASILTPLDIDTPPLQSDPSKRRSGRFDTAEFPVLYACGDVETTLHETRVKLGDEIVLGTLEVSTELTLIDLDFVREEIVDGRNVNADYHYFLRARLGSQESRDYRMLQLLAVQASASGFAGFKFQSFYSLLREDRNVAVNYALFGNPIREGKLSLKSWNAIRLLKMSYQFQFAPLPHTLWDL